LLKQNENLAKTANIEKPALLGSGEIQKPGSAPPAVIWQNTETRHDLPAGNL